MSREHHWYPEESDPDGERDVRWRCSYCYDLRFSVSEPPREGCPGSLTDPSNFVPHEGEHS